MSASTINGQQITRDNLIDILVYARETGSNEDTVNFLYNIVGMFDIVVGLGQYDYLINAIEEQFQTDIISLIDIALKHKNNKVIQENSIDEQIKFSKHDDENDGNDFNSTREVENSL